MDFFESLHIALGEGWRRSSGYLNQGVRYFQEIRRHSGSSESRSRASSASINPMEQIIPPVNDQPESAVVGLSEQPLTQYLKSILKEFPKPDETLLQMKQELATFKNMAIRKFRMMGLDIAFPEQGMLLPGETFSEELPLDYQTKKMLTRHNSEVKTLGHSAKNLEAYHLLLADSKSDMPSLQSHGKKESPKNQYPGCILKDMQACLKVISEVKAILPSITPPIWDKTKSYSDPEHLAVQRQQLDKSKYLVKCLHNIEKEEKKLDQMQLFFRSIPQETWDQATHHQGERRGSEYFASLFAAVGVKKDKIAPI